MNKKICSVLLALTGLLPVTLAQKQGLVYGTDARDSSGRPVRIIERINEDGTERMPLISPDFKGENFWPGYRGFGPNQYEYSDVSGKSISPAGLPMDQESHSLPISITIARSS